MTKSEKAKTESAEEIVLARGDGSSEVATLSPEESTKARTVMGEVVERNNAAMQTFVEWCVEKCEGTDEDTYNAAAAIIGEILSGGSAEEVLAERAPLSVSSLLNVPLLIHGFEIREGDYEDSTIGYYAAITVSKADSDMTRIVTTGAIKIMAKLFMLDRFGEWPQYVWFTAKDTRKKRTTYDMVRPILSGL